MAQIDGGDIVPEKFHESFKNRHQKEADLLRAEIEELVRNAKALLHGPESKSRLPPKPAAAGKRAERERELESALEKANWYRQEIKKLRRDLESWDRVSNFASNMAANDRDPMETYNLLVERRKELHRLQRNGQGLDKVAAAQLRAEAEQNALSPEIQERLQRAKNDVEEHKRLNIRLQADRQRFTSEKKLAEQEVRAAGSDLKRKEAQLQRAPARAKPSGEKPNAMNTMKHLQRDVDILSEAMRQDDRKFKLAQKNDEEQLESTRNDLARIQNEVSTHQTEIAKLRAALANEDPIGVMEERRPEAQDRIEPPLGAPSEDPAAQPPDVDEDPDEADDMAPLIEPPKASQ